VPRRSIPPGTTGLETWATQLYPKSDHFKQAEFSQGILQSIRKAGELPATHCPRQPSDGNELLDSVTDD
jgi:uncharacterized membrane protein